MRVRSVAIGAAATATVALGSLGLTIAKRLTAAHARRYNLTIRGVDCGREPPLVVLDRTAGTSAPGLYCLILKEGPWARLSNELEDRGPDFVGREVLGQPREDLTVGTRASWSGILFASPKDADLVATDVVISTDVGTAPAWLIPPRSGGGSDMWAIHIHGLGSSRAGTLRGAQVAADTGLTSLVVSHRNDGEGPGFGTGRSELGGAEADDVRAAVRWVRERGARKVVLFGWSMGAAIALQVAADKEFADAIMGLVLESPVLDWVSTIKANCARSGLPAWTGMLAVPWLDLALLARVTGLSNPVGLRRFDWITRAQDLSLPTLIIHGALDTSSPLELSIRLRDLRPDMVNLETFDADHTMSWNSDPERWRSVVRAWILKQSIPTPLASTGDSC